MVPPHNGHSRVSAIDKTHYCRSANLDKAAEWLLWLASVTMKPDSDCFADEVAIDFPSIAPFTARVRDAFLAGGVNDHDGTLKTEVCLSSDEAHRGAVVPIAVLLRSVCVQCGGRGEIWAEACLACRGTGDAIVPHRLRVVVPPRVADGSCFHFRIHAPQEASVHVEIRVAITES